MAYVSEGTLTTDKREIAISETWDSQSDWEAYQSASGVVIENGVVSLSEGIVIDDFEDGDTTPANSNWGAWSADGGTFSATQTTNLGGNYAGEYVVSNAWSEVTTDRNSSFTPGGMSFKARIASQTSSNDRQAFIVRDGGMTSIIELWFNHSSNEIEILDGGTNVSLQSWAANTTYTVEFTNIDYSAGTYTVVIDGTDHGSYAFNNSGSNVQTFGISHRTSSSGGSYSAFVDDVERL